MKTIRKHHKKWCTTVVVVLMFMLVATSATQAFVGFGFRKTEQTSDTGTLLEQVLSGSLLGQLRERLMGRGGHSGFTPLQTFLQRFFRISEDDEMAKEVKETSPMQTLDNPYFTWEDDFDNQEWIEFGMSYDYEVSDGVATIKNTYPIWTDPAWTRMKPVTVINNAGQPLPDYAVSLTVDYDSDMKPGFEDIRFKHENYPTIWLDYWIESKDASEAVVWVKIPSIPTGQSVMYLFYGNPVADDESDFYSVFSDWDEQWPNDEQISYHAYTEGAWDSDVAYGSDKFLVAWEEGTVIPFIKQEIRGTIFNSDGSIVPSAEDFKIYGGSGLQYLDQNPSIAFGGTKFFVAWEHYGTPSDPSTMDIMGRLVTTSGGTGSVKTICSYSNIQADPNVEFDSVNNHFCIVWEDARDGVGNYDIYGRLYDTNGGTVGGQKAICTAGNGQTEPWVAFDHVNNQYMIVWEDGETANNGPFDIWAGLFDSSLNSISSPIKLADGTTNTDYNFPCVEFCEETERFLVTWNDGDISDGDWYGNIWGTLLDESGNVVVSTFQIKGGNFIRTDIVPYLSSSFLVSYDGGDKIWGRLVSSEGEVFDTEIQLSASSSAEADWANMAVGSGKIFVTWEDERIASYTRPDAYGNIWCLNIPSGSDVSCVIGDEKTLILTAQITSKVIQPDDLIFWHNFSVDFDGSITFDILDETGDIVLIEGASSGEDMSGIDPEIYPGIRLQAHFSRDNPSYTPTLDRWSVTYIGVDEDPPETTISDIIGTYGENGWYIGNVAIYLVATDGQFGTGVNHTYFKIDDGEVQDYDDQTGIELPPYDPHTLAGEWDVYYWSVDKANNTEPMNGPEHIKIDKAPPHCDIFEPADRAWVWGDFWVKATATDEGSGISYVLFDIGPPYDDPVLVYDDDPAGSGVYKWKCTRDYWLQWKHIIAQVYDDAGHMYEDNIYVFFFFPESVCFLAGTEITMADESYKNIEDVEVGDLVKSYDMATGELGDAAVTKTYHHASQEMTDHYLIINDKLRVTPNHLLYINGELVQAGDVKEGDRLASGGSGSKVNSIQQVFRQVPTYNFELETSTQLYFADGIPAYPYKPGSRQAASQGSSSEQSSSGSSGQAAS